MASLAVSPKAPAPSPLVNIVEEAERRLQAGPYPVLRQIGCEFCDGVLILRGAVGSFYLKQMAQTLVSRIPGVSRVENQLNVASAR
ncbi:MAG: BON domain-containing protein [Pirellulales bacterium]